MLEDIIGNMRRKKEALTLIGDLLETAREEDKLHKAWCIQNHKAQQAEGESFHVFHLKVLKELIERED